MGQFKFSQKSLDRLKGVHPDLADLLKEAIDHSLIDFGVVEGLRSMERQQDLVEQELSQTLRSKHLMQEDGWGHAVDLVPYRGSKPCWEWQYIFTMAEAIQRTLLNRIDLKGYPHIRWGGAWTLLHSTKSPRELQEGYVQSCRQAGRKPFLDGPHFEILNPR
jgi:peptidoglycan L-alanyl-D-glutamate endopeptidase CwlK